MLEEAAKIEINKALSNKVCEQFLISTSRNNAKFNNAECRIVLLF